MIGWRRLVLLYVVAGVVGTVATEVLMAPTALVGASGAIFALYGVIAQRGLRIAATAADDFRALLASGLTLVVVIQAAIIIGGNLRVIPLTGVTLPFVSYGGSSLLVNGAIIGLLLALSDQQVEPPPLPRQRAGLLGRLRRRARAVGGRVEEVVS